MKLILIGPYETGKSYAASLFKLGSKKTVLLNGRSLDQCKNEHDINYWFRVKMKGVAEADLVTIDDIPKNKFNIVAAFFAAAEFTYHYYRIGEIKISPNIILIMDTGLDLQTATIIPELQKIYTVIECVAPGREGVFMKAFNPDPIPDDKYRQIQNRFPNTSTVSTIQGEMNAEVFAKLDPSIQRKIVVVKFDDYYGTSNHSTVL